VHVSLALHRAWKRQWPDIGSVPATHKHAGCVHATLTFLAGLLLADVQDVQLKLTLTQASARNSEARNCKWDMESWSSVSPTFGMGHLVLRSCIACPLRRCRIFYMHTLIKLQLNAE
jgi:hypothetical protein